MEFGTAEMGRGVVSIASWYAGRVGVRKAGTVAEMILPITRHIELMKMTDAERRVFFDAARARRVVEDQAKGGHLAKDGTLCGDGLGYHPGCTNPGKSSQPGRDAGVGRK